VGHRHRALEHRDFSAAGRSRQTPFNANKDVYHVCFGSIDQAGLRIVRVMAAEKAAFMPHVACGAARLIPVKTQDEKSALARTKELWKHPGTADE
jgi:hypothetical protein